MAGMNLEALAALRASLGMAKAADNKETDSKNSSLSFKAAKSDADSDDEPGSTLESREAMASDNWLKLQKEQQDKKRKEERRTKLKKEREAAQRYARLEGKGLGEDDADDSSARDWLLGASKRQKKIEKQRQREAELEAEEKRKRAEYTEKDLAGAKVAHEFGDFEAGADQILTLKDANVDDDEDDELENLSMREKERLKERLELKKGRPVYDPMSEDAGQSSILGQYDEEIDGKKKKTFTLGEQWAMFDKEALTKKDAEDKRRQQVSLDMPTEEKPAVSDYMDISEVKVKKPKKKKDKAKKSKRTGDDDDEERDDQMDLDLPAAAPASRKRTVDESFVDDEDLQAQLAAQRRAALKKRKVAKPEDLAKQLRQEAEAQENTPAAEGDAPDGAAGAVETVEEDEEGGLLIDQNAEFVTHLEKPTEEETKPRRPSPVPQPVPPPEGAVEEDEDGDAVMNRAANGDEDAHAQRDTGSAAPADITQTGLDDETTVGTAGLAATMKLLTQRGLLQKGDSNEKNTLFRDRQRFLIEKQKREEEAERKARVQRERDRASGKFERMSAREREQYAQWENKNRDQIESRQMAEVFNKEYKPNVELKYTDEYGRSMNQREAFKHLSHQFHGKGSGAGKTEKRMKKIADERTRESQSMLDSSEAMGMNNAAGATAKKNKTAGVRLQ